MQTKTHILHSIHVVQLHTDQNNFNFFVSKSVVELDVIYQFEWQCNCTTI